MSTIGSIGILLLSAAFLPALAADAEKSPPVKIAVFAFELEDASPAASLPGEATSSAAIVENVSSEAHRVLAQSGRYSLIDVSKVDAKPVTAKSLRNCNGCEASIALQLGAEQSLIGRQIEPHSTIQFGSIPYNGTKIGRRTRCCFSDFQYDVANDLPGWLGTQAAAGNPCVDWSAGHQ